jgi:hypothetical protein
LPVSEHEYLFLLGARRPLTLGDGALQARVEDIAREERDQVRLPLKSLALAILPAHRDEARHAAHRLRGRRVEVIDVVVVENPEVGRRGLPVRRCPARAERHRFSLRRHLAAPKSVCTWNGESIGVWKEICTEPTKRSEFYVSW